MSAWVKCNCLHSRNRQDAIEALDIASLGKVKCHLEVKPLASLSEYVFILEDWPVLYLSCLFSGCTKAWSRVRSQDALC